METELKNSMRSASFLELMTAIRIVVYISAETRFYSLMKSVTTTLLEQTAMDAMIPVIRKEDILVSGNYLSHQSAHIFMSAGITPMSLTIELYMSNVILTKEDVMKIAR